MTSSMKLNTSRIESHPSMLMEVMITYILYYICIRIRKNINCRFLVEPFGFSVGMTYFWDIILYVFTVTRSIRNDIYGSECSIYFMLLWLNYYKIGIIILVINLQLGIILVTMKSIIAWSYQKKDEPVRSSFLVLVIIFVFLVI